MPKQLQVQINMFVDIFHLTGLVNISGVQEGLTVWEGI